MALEGLIDAEKPQFGEFVQHPLQDAPVQTTADGIAETAVAAAQKAQVHADCGVFLFGQLGLGEKVIARRQMFGQHSRHPGDLAHGLAQPFRLGR